MGQFAVYSFISGLILLASYIIYKWLLASENQPGFNRGVLLTIYVLSFIALPFSETIAAGGNHSETDITLGNIAVELSGKASDAYAASPILCIILWIYLAGMIVTALWTVAIGIKIYRIILSGEKHELDKFTIVLIRRQGIAPFSWRHYVVMSNDEDAEAKSMILCHERAHIECHHFVDLLLAQIVCIILWYNPAAWLMLAELKSVHEYQADSHVLASGVNCRQYQHLLIKKAVGVRFPSLANSLNHSKLKKRITMMYNQKTSPVRRTRALALVPAVALTLALVNIPSVSNAFGRAASAGLNFTTAEIDSKVTNSLPFEQMHEQSTIAAAEEKTAEKSDQVPDKLPQFEGGELMLMKYLMDNVKYPKEAEKAGAEGRVVVRFTISADGSVSDVNVDRPINPALDAEAIRVVKSMNGRWIPGESGSKKINCTFSLPISFKLSKGKDSK